MMNRLTFPIVLLLLMSPAVLAQDLVTTRQAIMVENSSMSLNSDRKDKLNLSVSGRAFTGAVALPKNTLVKVLSRGQFTARITRNGGATTKRDFKAVYVQVQVGEHFGKKGWVVQSVQDKGRGATAYLKTAPADQQANQQASAQASTHAADMPDLAITVSTPDSRIQLAGKKVYDISIANTGSVEAARGVTVLVKIGQQVIKTERINKAIPARGFHRFSVEVRESAASRHEKLTVIVDSGNTVEESNEKNNTYTRTL